MGGLERIRSVRTMVRETVVYRRSVHGRPEPCELTITHRAAGGKIRIDTIPFETGVVQPGGWSGPHRLIVPPATGDLAARALRAARLEPRTLLAHVHERRALLRPSKRGDRAHAPEIEIELPEDHALFTFDAESGLCVGRRDFETGLERTYLGWCPVDGISTPFLEIDQPIRDESRESSRRSAGVGGAPLDAESLPHDGNRRDDTTAPSIRIEHHLIAIAYNLAFPDSLFRP